jgi:hypothetical protein
MEFGGPTMDCFDYEAAAREAGLSDQELRQVCVLVRDEFPHDDMLFELHVMRICLAIKEGRTSVARIVGHESALAA